MTSMDIIHKIVYEYGYMLIGIVFIIGLIAGVLVGKTGKI